MSDLLFAPAWWMLVAGFLAGAALFYLGNSRVDKVLMRTGIGVAILTVVWLIIGMSVDTPHESALDGTKAFVKAVVDRDQSKMTDTLGTTATLGMLTKIDIMKAAQVYAERWGLKSAYISNSELEDRGTQINCTVTIISMHDAVEASPTMKSDWVFTWGQTSEGWRIVQISPVRVGSDTEVIRKYFSSKP